MTIYFSQGFSQSEALTFFILNPEFDLRFNLQNLKKKVRFEV